MALNCFIVQNNLISTNAFNNKFSINTLTPPTKKTTISALYQNTSRSVYDDSTHPKQYKSNFVSVKLFIQLP